MPDSTPPNLVAIGASAGGIAPLRTIARGLPADFGGALVVCVHLSPVWKSELAPLLARSGNLPAVTAVDGMRLEPGRFHVGPPDRHLTVEGDVLRLDASARENGFRPAIDRLFRSVATSHGPRSIGVILSGMRDDGVEGLANMKRSGALTIVQDPNEAEYASMPLQAVERVKVDFVVPSDHIAELLVHPPAIPVPSPNPNRSEEDASDDEPVFRCPDCGGVVQEMSGEAGTRFKCRAGHVFSMTSFVEDHARAVEAALWSAVSALAERRVLTQRLADRAAQQGHVHSAKMYRLLATEAESRRKQIVDTIVRSSNPPEKRE